MLRNGATFDLADLPDGMAIVADPASVEQNKSASIGSVRFELSGPDGLLDRTENVAPFAMVGNDGESFSSWNATPGQFRLRVTPFTEANQRGVAGEPVVIEFTVTAGQSDNSEPVVPSAGTVTDTGTRAEVSLLDDVIYAGQSVHADAWATELGVGDWNDATFAWTFEDADGRSTSYRGFVAGHLYEKAGTYDVTLTVRDEAGFVHEASKEVRVAASSRRLVHIDAWSGSDDHDGRTASRAVRTAERAQEILESTGDHVEILFRRGQSHDVATTFELRNDDIVLGAYGGGQKPVVNWVGEQDNHRSIVTVAPQAQGVTVRDLHLDVPDAHAHTDKRGASAVTAGGRGVAVVNNTFGAVINAVNANGKPDGLLVRGNQAASETGIRAYFVWGEGSRVSILDNFVANSTREHVVRLSSGIKGVTISGNNFNNISRRPDGDRYDTVKTAINVQHGSFAYVTNNTLVGDNAMGPLGKGDGLSHTEARFEYAVWEHNDHVGGGSMFLNHGLEHADFRFNAMANDDSVAVHMEGYDGRFSRGVVDMTIHGNFASNQGTYGGFLNVWAGAREVTLTDNVYVAPALNVFPEAVLRIRGSVDSFTHIGGNIWPASHAGGYHDGGVHHLGGSSNDLAGYQSPQEWNALRQVSGDRFVDVDASVLGTLIGSISDNADDRSAAQAWRRAA